MLCLPYNVHVVSIHSNLALNEMKNISTINNSFIIKYFHHVFMNHNVTDSCINMYAGQDSTAIKTRGQLFKVSLA